LKTYHLKAVEYGGKSFTECSLVIDTDTHKAEVKRPAGIFKREMVAVASLTWGSGTPVQVSGAVVRSGDVTFVADDNAAAQEISKALQTEVTAGVPPTDKFAAIKAPMSAFLTMRAEGIGFLVELKTDPRRALVDAASTYSGTYENPALEYLMKFSATLAESHAKMTYAAAEVQESVGIVAVERIFAFVCAVGVYQDDFVAGTGFTEELGAFMRELDLEGEPITEADVKEGTKTMLRRSEPLFSNFPPLA